MFTLGPQLTSTLPTGSISCTYSELMKMKTKLELFFAAKQAKDIIRAIPNTRLPTGESWINGLSCSITDEEIISVIRSAYPSVACPSS